MDNGKSGWNVMVYLAGNNNLSEECVWTLTEIQKAMQGKEGQGVVVSAQFDSPVSDTEKPRYLFGVKDDGPMSEGLDVNRKRPADVEERGYQQRGKQSGPKSEGLRPNEDRRTDVEERSPQRVLRDFICDSIVEHSAEHYLLVLSGHGSGTDGDFLRSGDRALSIPELREVFEGEGKLKGVKKQLEDKEEEELKKNRIRKNFLGVEGKEGGKKERKIDILGMDSCLMSMAEVGYELRNHVRYMVGAEGFEANTGWPFREILTQLIEHQGELVENLISTFVSEYINYYTNYVIAGRFVDIAACDLSHCKALASAIQGLAKVLDKNKLKDIRVKNAVLLAHWEAQSYKDDRYVDLYDFCQVLQRKLEELGYDRPERKEEKEKSDIWRACERVKEAVNKMVVKSCYSGPTVQHSHGLSIYFPWSRVSDRYGELKFAVDTGWHNFLKRYVEITRRELRIPKWIERTPEKDRPKPLDTSGQPVVDTSLPSNNRDAAPDNRDAAPDNRMLNSSIGSMKNPPILYYPDDCSREGK